MSLVYVEGLRKILADGLAGLDLRVALLLNTTTADTEEDVTTLSGFTTLGEVVDASYSRKAIANEAIAGDFVNDRAELNGDTVQWLNLTTGGPVAGALVYIHVTNDTDSIPVAFLDSGGFPITLNGVDFDLPWNAEGILQMIFQP